MKIHDISGRHEVAALAADFSSAERFDTIYVGDIGVYYRDGFHMKHIPYDYVQRVFLRIQEVVGRLCCGSTVFRYFRLVFVCGGKEIADAMSESETAFSAAFEKIKEKAPFLSFGVEE